jgi:hypothetical protein
MRFNIFLLQCHFFVGWSQNNSRGRRGADGTFITSLGIKVAEGREVKFMRGLMTEIILHGLRLKYN